MFIPKQQIQESGVNFLEVLRSIPPAELLRKQRAIARIAPRLQYSVVSEFEVYLYCLCVGVGVSARWCCIFIAMSVNSEN